MFIFILKCSRTIIWMGRHIRYLLLLKCNFVVLQREYYATHQYFLSKRSVYLVLWKVTDGEKGVNEILQWLVSVQVGVVSSSTICIDNSCLVANMNTFIS